MTDDEPVPQFHPRSAAPDGTAGEPLTRFTLQLDMPDADAGELDDLTRQLRGEILDTSVEQVDLVPGAPAPEGAKGLVAAAHGELAVSLKPGGLPDFLGLLRDWLTRHEDRRVEVTLNIGGNPVNIKASITDISAVMQAVSASMTTINRSGGADLNADQINVGGDVTGRDKIIQIKAEAGATVYVGQTGPASVKTDGGDPAAG
jgi:hypothetical protein